MEKDQVNSIIKFQTVVIFKFAEGKKKASEFQQIILFFPPCIYFQERQRNEKKNDARIDALMHVSLSETEKKMVGEKKRNNVGLLV